MLDLLPKESKLRRKLCTIFFKELNKFTFMANIEQDTRFDFIIWLTAHFLDNFEV
jgi:hypothetical protein